MSTVHTANNGKHYVILNTKIARTPICAHEVNLAYCVEDGCFFGDKIGPDGWCNLTDEEIETYVEMFDAKAFVSKALQLGSASND